MCFRVATDSRFRLDPAALREAHLRAEKAGRRVFAIVGSACSTVTGAFDPLEAIADYAAEHNLWFRVDGAHGTAAALTPKYKHLVAGIGRADSVIIDAHKMPRCPRSSPRSFQPPRNVNRAFRQEQSYVGFRSEGDTYPWWDRGLRTLECTKRMMALGLYDEPSTTHGTDSFGDHIEQTFDLARTFADLCGAGTRLRPARRTASKHRLLPPRTERAPLTSTSSNCESRKRSSAAATSTSSRPNCKASTSGSRS